MAMKTEQPAPPTPQEIKARFIVPKPIVDLMVPWLGIGESLAYKMIRQGQKPSKRTAQLIEERTGVPTEIWEEPVDIRIEKVYTIWYGTISKITDLF